MSYADKTLTCRDCGTQFVFTAGEQEFYQLKGLVNEPGRCPECRSARKSQRGGGGMAYDSDRGYGGGSGYGGGGAQQGRTEDPWATGPSGGGNAYAGAGEDPPF